MGTSHAASGALGWMLIVPAVAGIAAAPVEGKVLVAGTIVTAGAALLPDLDHPKSTIAYTLGPVTHALARGVNLVSGGHRQGTHSILFAVLMGVLTQIAAQLSDVAALIIFWCMAALAIKALHLTPPGKSHNVKSVFVVLEATALAYAVNVFMPGDWWWLGIAVALGCLLHLGGDCLTPEGVPYFYPWKKRFSIPIISHTGNALETKVLAPLMILATLYLMYRNLWPDIQQRLPWEQ